MNEDRLRALLRETPAPGEEAAAQRGLRVASEAFARREPPRRRARPRLGLAFAIGVLLAGLTLSPAGAKVRDWIGDVFTAGVPNAERALTDLPGGGRLLVQTQDGAWVVQPDGSRRLLGRFQDATWSPHGLFVAATDGHTLSALDPEGNLRWSISAGAATSDPRWSAGSGFRIAYRADSTLRVVGADGSKDGLKDGLLDPQAAAVAPVWSPQGLHLLVYADAAQRLRVVNADTAEVLGSAKALPGVGLLDWSADGSMLLETSPRALRIRAVRTSKLVEELALEAPRDVRLAAAASVETAAFSPNGATVAALLYSRGNGTKPAHSEVVVVDPAGGPPRRLFSVSGRLSDLAWSPDGRWLLVSWPDADQWLFIPVGGPGKIRAIGGISGEFAPGEGDSSFPRIDGWCCPTVPAGNG
ncbi:MAG TPA: hypothetical protein VIY71_05635 [Solirubrobacterales bacterium]